MLIANYNNCRQTRRRIDDFFTGGYEAKLVRALELHSWRTVYAHCLGPDIRCTHTPGLVNETEIIFSPKLGVTLITVYRTST